MRKVRRAGREVLIAYVDETGNTGDPSLKGATACFGLGCVLVDVSNWAESFDKLVAFRREMRKSIGLPMKAEVKANFLIRGSGPFRGKTPIPPGIRRGIYRAYMRLLGDLDARAFGVVVDKEKTETSGRPCFDLTWQTLIERLERTSSKEDKEILVVHDDGENEAVRKLFRKARRHLVAPKLGGEGYFTYKANRIIEDPVSRQSHHSYWVQMADLVAYAAWRRRYPPSAAVAAVVGQDTWDLIPRRSVHAAVNSVRGGAPGIVVRTERRRRK